MSTHIGVCSGISRDEYMGVLSKELTAKRIKEELLLLKTDMVM